MRWIDESQRETGKNLKPALSEKGLSSSGFDLCIVLNIVITILNVISDAAGFDLNSVFWLSLSFIRARALSLSLCLTRLLLEYFMHCTQYS